MNYLVKATPTRRLAELGAEERDALMPGERAAAEALIAAGDLVWMWRFPGGTTSVSIWKVDDSERLDERLRTLPLRPYHDFEITALDSHPAFPAPCVPVLRKAPSMSRHRRPRSLRTGLARRMTDIAGEVRGPSRASRAVVGSLIAAIGVGPTIMDQLWEPIARQHMRNPAWSPHAKFHDAQYITMSALISAIALRILFQREGDPRVRLRNAAALSSVSWLGMWGAMLFPGTAATDPEFASEPTERTIAGLPPQLFISVVGLSGLAATVTAEAVRARHEVGSAAVQQRS